MRPTLRPICPQRKRNSWRIRRCRLRQPHSTPVTVATWHDKPSYGIVATEDRALNPKLARWMYKRSGAKTTEIKANHLVYISQPDAVARVIETAARSAGANTTKAQ